MTADTYQVLLIEDNSRESRLIEIILDEADSADFKSERVDRLAGGLERLQQGGIDIVLLDLSLPDSFGLDTFRKLHQRVPDVPIIVLSGTDDERLAFHAVQEGAQDYLVKGPDLDKFLVRSVRYAIERFRIIEQVRQREQHLRLITEQLPASFWTTDSDLIIASCSDSGVLGSGGAADSLVGRGLLELFPDDQPDAAFFFDAHKQAIVGQSQSFDVRLNGRVYHTHVEPLRQRDGRIMGTIGLALDVTGQMLVELELRLTQQIQQGLRPESPPDMPGFDIAGKGHSCAAAGGDYFDYFDFPDGSKGFVICDVGGNGLGPAMLMAQTRAYLRAFAQADLDPGRILTNVNRFLCDDTSEQRLVALFLAKIDGASRRMVYSAAGHRSHRLRPSGEWEEIAMAGIPLNIAPDAQYDAPPEFDLESGDILLLYTDGMMECSGPHEDPFGMDRMLDLVKTHRAAPAAEIVERLFDAVWDYAQDSAQDDDMTTVVIKVL